jgi:hypothetical protein
MVRTADALGLDPLPDKVPNALVEAADGWRQRRGAGANPSEVRDAFALVEHRLRVSDLVRIAEVISPVVRCVWLSFSSAEEAAVFAARAVHAARRGVLPVSLLEPVLLAWDARLRRVIADRFAGTPPIMDSQLMFMVTYGPAGPRRPFPVYCNVAELSLTTAAQAQHLRSEFSLALGRLTDARPQLRVGGGLVAAAVAERLEAACLACSAAGHLQVCSTCRGVRYCSRECQRRDWPLHRGQECADARVVAARLLSSGSSSAGL